MNEAVSTISEAIVQLVNAGGPYALWAAIIVYVVPKLITGGVIICLARLALQATSDILLHNRESRNKAISLVGSEVSQEMTDSIHGIERSVTSALRLVQSMTEETEKSVEQIRSYVEQSLKCGKQSPGQSTSTEGGE